MSNWTLAFPRRIETTPNPGQFHLVVEFQDGKGAAIKDDFVAYLVSADALTLLLSDRARALEAQDSIPKIDPNIGIDVSAPKPQAPDNSPVVA